MEVASAGKIHHRAKAKKKTRSAGGRTSITERADHGMEKLVRVDGL
jgi:hypothetical protein